MVIEPENIKRYINEAAEWVRAEVSASPDKYEVYDLIEKKCRWMTDNVVVALTIINSYGWSGALYGDVDYEDSPQYKFEDAVCDRVKEMLLDDGIEIG